MYTVNTHLYDLIYIIIYNETITVVSTIYTYIDAIDLSIIIEKRINSAGSTAAQQEALKRCKDASR